MGITVTRKVGSAVCRNRIKRLAREWFRACTCDLGSRDVVLVAKRSIPERLRLTEVCVGLEASLRDASWLD